MAADVDDLRDRAIFDDRRMRLRTESWATAPTIECDRQVVGYIYSREHFGAPEVEFWIAREHWGKGIATAALAEFLELEPERPLYASVAQDNLGALRVLEKLGFQVSQEGTSFETARNEPLPILLLAVGLDT